MKGVGPGVLDKPLEDDPRFEQLPTTVCTEDFLDLSGDALAMTSAQRCASRSGKVGNSSTYLSEMIVQEVPCHFKARRTWSRTCMMVSVPQDAVIGLHWRRLWNVRTRPSNKDRGKHQRKDTNL